MNVNDFSGKVLEEYRRNRMYPENGDIPCHLCRLYRLVTECLDEWEKLREKHLPLIYATCAISPEDCEAWETCNLDGKGENVTCSPEGLAFRLGDVVLYTMAVMRELGIDVDAVLTAQLKYLQQKGGNEHEDLCNDKLQLD